MLNFRPTCAHSPSPLAQNQPLSRAMRAHRTRMSRLLNSSFNGYLAYRTKTCLPLRESSAKTLWRSLPVLLSLARYPSSKDHSSSTLRPRMTSRSQTSAL